VIISALDHQFSNLCRAMGQPELVQDVRFKTAADRATNQKALIAIIEDWLQSAASDDASMAAMKELRVPHAPVLSVAEAVKHPHLRQRGTVRTVHDQMLGDFEVPGFALRFSDYPERLGLGAPTLGQHNASVLSNFLGYSADRIHALESRGVLQSARR